MKRAAFLAAILVFVLAVPALAQDGGEFCAIPEGCDLDGDGVAETPAGAPAPAEGQYGPEEEFCAIPEGCDASASPDPEEEFCAIPEGCDASASPDPVEGSVPPSPPATSSAPAPEEDTGSAEASSPAGGDTGAGSTEASPSVEASSPAEESADSGFGGGSDVGSASSSAEEDAPTAGLTVLPETGGASAATLGLGVALVASGVLVRRILR